MSQNMHSKKMPPESDTIMFRILFFLDKRKPLPAACVFNREDTCTKESATDSSNIYQTTVERKVISAYRNQAYLETHSDDLPSLEHKRYSLSHGDNNAYAYSECENLTNKKVSLAKVSNITIFFLITVLLIVISKRADLLSRYHKS